MLYKYTVLFRGALWNKCNGLICVWRYYHVARTKVSKMNKIHGCKNLHFIFCAKLLKLFAEKSTQNQSTCNFVFGKQGLNSLWVFKYAAQTFLQERKKNVQKNLRYSLFLQHMILWKRYAFKHTSSELSEAETIPRNPNSLVKSSLCMKKDTNATIQTDEKIGLDDPFSTV